MTEYTLKPMTKIKIDRIDRRILTDLQDNGRMTNVELAKRAGISAPPCLRRVRNLEDLGLIKGYYTEINANALGYTLTVVALVKMNVVSENEVKKFEELLQSWPLVREAHMMTGEYDFMLKIVAPDWDAYQQFLTQHLLNAPNITTVNSSPTVRVSKNKPGVPIEN